MGALRKPEEKNTHRHEHAHDDEHEDDHRKSHAHMEEEEGEPWLVSYADMMTLLFGFFVLLYSFAAAKEGTKSLDKLKDAMAKQFGHEAKTATVDDEVKRQPVITSNSFSSDWEISEEESKKDQSKNQGQSTTYAKTAEKLKTKSTKPTRPNEFQLVLPLASLFKDGGEQLSPDGKIKLKKIADEFVQNENAEKMIVEVHGAFKAEPRNAALRRTSFQSSTILSELTSAGVPITKLIAGGYGNLVTLRSNAKLQEGEKPGKGRIAQYVLFRLQKSSETSEPAPR
ncbi:hypothetical protein EBR21_01140 [bacterium]|jgi:outer membrane protein OmpA-like peptidoglycan-associated protein|nr:hypothetical protein [bacterium]